MCKGVCKGVCKFSLQVCAGVCRCVQVCAGVCRCVQTWLALKQKLLQFLSWRSDLLLPCDGDTPCPSEVVGACRHLPLDSVSESNVVDNIYTD